MTIDISKIKPGDTITVELIVADGVSGQPGNVLCGPPGNTMANSIFPRTIISHTPKPVEIVVGTEYTPFVTAEGPARVIAIAEGFCLVRYSDGSAGCVKEGSIRNILKGS